MDPAVIGSMRVGYFRIGVMQPTWDNKVLRALKSGGLSEDVTRRILMLGSRDGLTGWRAKTYTEETVGMVLFDRGTSFSYQGVGYYATHELMGITPDPVNVYDQILHPNGSYYEVKTKKPVYRLDNFEFYVYQLAHLPLYQAEPSSQTAPSGMPTDARSNTKTWVDTYANADHTWITKNDGIAPANFATIWERPPYPLELEFRGGSNMDGLYVVGMPTTTPLMDPVTQTPYGYREVVPIKCYTIDGTDVTGVVLANKMEKELRYVAETYMTGSLRSPSRMQPREIQLGSTVLYETTFDLVYERGLT